VTPSWMVMMKTPSMTNWSSGFMVFIALQSFRIDSMKILPISTLFFGSWSVSFGTDRETMNCGMYFWTTPPFKSLAKFYGVALHRFNVKSPLLCLLDLLCFGSVWTKLVNGRFDCWLGGCFYCKDFSNLFE